MKNIFFVLFIFTCAACSSIRTSYDYDDQVNFSKYNTFNFTEASENLPVNDLVRRRIFAAIEKNMKSKGYSLSENPDVLIDLHVKTEEKKQTTATTMNLGTSYARRWGFRSGVGVSSTQFDTREYTVGTLFIDIGDVDKKMLIWSGQGTSTVTKKSITEERMEEGINEILSNYPPQD